MPPLDTTPARPAAETVAGFAVRPGLFRVPGATPVPGGVSFTIQSEQATACELCLFHRRQQQPFAVLPYPPDCRVGHVYSMIVYGLDIDEIEYAYRMDGPRDPRGGCCSTGTGTCWIPTPAP